MARSATRPPDDEEEKLAHDVYVALAGTWGSRVFKNIAGAETTHGEAIKALEELGE